MEQHIIFFDIDGTLYNRNKKLSTATINTLKQLQEKGHILSIASGRAPFMMKDVMEQTGIKHLVGFNGQYVQADNEVVHAHPIDIETLIKLEELAARHDHPMVFLTDTEMVSNVEDHHHIFKSMQTLHFDHPEFKPGFYHDHPIYQALLFQAAEDDIVYDGQFDTIKFIRWHELSRDVVPHDGSKLAGITKLCEHFNIPIERTIAIGDGLNDVEMIEGAAIGIAMGNAVDEVKAVSDLITGDVDDDGLTDAFKQLKLI